MRRVGETARRRTNRQTLKGAVAMGHCPHEHIGRSLLASHPYQIVSHHHVARVEHADAVGSVRTVEYHGADKRAFLPDLGVDILASRFWKSPRTNIACVWTDTRLDAVDGASPNSKTHVVRSS